MACIRLLVRLPAGDRLDGFRVFAAPDRCRRCKRRFTAVARPDVVCAGPPVHAAGPVIGGGARAFWCVASPRCNAVSMRVYTGGRVFVYACACVRATCVRVCTVQACTYRVSEMRVRDTRRGVAKGALKSEPTRVWSKTCLSKLFKKIIKNSVHLRLILVAV